jgi:hypothetical protein
MLTLKNWIERNYSLLKFDELTQNYDYLNSLAFQIYQQFLNNKLSKLELHQLNQEIHDLQNPFFTQQKHLFSIQNRGVYR